MTIPTPGRVMLFHPAKDQQTNNFVLPRAGQPLAGIVASVSECGNFVNLTVLDASGWPHAKTDVPVVHAGDAPPADGRYACWSNKARFEEVTIANATGRQSTVAERELRKELLSFAVAFCRDTDFDVVTIAQRYEQYVNGGK